MTSHQYKLIGASPVKILCRNYQLVDRRRLRRIDMPVQSKCGNKKKQGKLNLLSPTKTTELGSTEAGQFGRIDVIWFVNLETRAYV